ncbi:hypothetical protein J2X69_004335 [Algoriphagus sp. 4150]|uniref:HAEPLYID family protein n=1 Tax=Algoriphagus sp. 4150 TaxID=2817756 RepID=UPI0028609BA6|nr:HAEPLYID family protein [Algoriphagus sp. 4150]MDR7131969.1 hypothetical protein [Algoriphagus sp. 4150]
MKITIIGIITILTLTNLYAQTDSLKAVQDSLYIHEVQDKSEPAKVLHAEPLYIDLIRDLGARKGEKEWNVGLGLTDNNKYDEYTALVEYEWAPINRLGLEVELPFSFYYPTNGNGSAPSSKLNSVKLAAQYSFYVSQKYQTSMAIGYIHEFEVTEFNKYGDGKLFTGNVYNPFFIAAKRLGMNWHTLLYTGPAFIQHFSGESMSTSWQINSNLHYMIPGTRNFLGLEFNKTIKNGDFDMTIRPQMRVGITDNLLIGIVTGIPISRENQRFSSFLRLIYEPKHN